MAEASEIPNGSVARLILRSQNPCGMNNVVEYVFQ